MLSQRVRTIEPSATLGMNTAIQKLRAAGQDIINFSVGEPDFDTPEFIREAAKRAIDAGQTRYTPVPGTTELRAAVADFVGSVRGESVRPEEVIITSGAKQALAEALTALCDPGDEVLLPAPYWVSYPDEIRITDAIPVVVTPPAETGFRVTPESLAPYVTPRTIGLILNSPSNPTGAVLSAAEITAFVEFAEQHDLWILSDEIYERFVFDGTFASPFSGEGRARTILVSGLSKSFAMTGWRIGWAVADPALISGMSRLQSHIASNACSISQAAALEAVRNPDHPDLLAMLGAFAARRTRALEILGEIEGLAVLPPEGAFYLFVDLRAFLGAAGPRAGSALCQELLEDRGVATVPGDAFGLPGWARISTARSMEEIERGLGILGEFLRAR